MSSLQTIKEGTLNKRGKINTEWRQRLFILNGKNLSYFKGGRHTPSGTIDLKEISEISDPSANGTFSIMTASRTYEIRADTRAESEQWIAAIRQAKKDA